MGGNNFKTLSQVPSRILNSSPLQNDGGLMRAGVEGNHMPEGNERNLYI